MHFNDLSTTQQRAYGDKLRETVGDEKANEVLNALYTGEEKPNPTIMAKLLGANERSSDRSLA